MNKNYISNRLPLLETPFIELPLGSVMAKGWLRTQLILQAEGLTGNLEDIWGDVGTNSGWLGGTGENWERGPYYCDGLVPLAYLLKNDILIGKAQKWIEWTLQSQREDGFFGPQENEDWWPRMVMLKVLKEYYEATEDQRIIHFMGKYFKYQYNNTVDRPLKMWAKARGAEELLIIYWLYNITGESFLLDLAQIIFKQTINWTAYFQDIPFKKSIKKYLPWDKFAEIGWQKILNAEGITKEQADELFQIYHTSHVVNVAMGIKEPVVFYQQSKDSTNKDAIEKGIQDLMKYHGVIYGMFTGDEHLSGNSPSQGTELCAVVEYMFSLENIIRILGEGKFADILEKVAYNALPATLTSDIKAHQYVQQANQVICSSEEREWYNNGRDANVYGLEPNFGCCTANMHQGWPKFVKSMWMATSDSGLAAVAYGPSIVNARVADGVNVEISEDTEYPFNETIVFKINPERRVCFPLKLRIPQWCENAEISINEEKINVESSNGFCSIERIWGINDVVILTLPMHIRVSTWAYDSIGIERGSLVFGLRIDENWKKLRGVDPYADWEVYPKTPWNYGLLLDESNKEHNFKIVKGIVEAQPFQNENSPIKLLVKAKIVENWGLKNNSADIIPSNPVVDENEYEIELIPYGSTNIRISQFPSIEMARL